MEPLLAGRTVLVTGGAQPGTIGEAISRACAEHGAHVLVGSRSLERANAAAAQLRSLGLAATGVACDVTSDASVDALVAAFPATDGVVHNAGAPIQAWDRSFLDLAVDDFRAAIEVDLLGGIRLARAIIPKMVQRGGGSFVFTSSTAALAGYEALHEFAPAKAGVLGLVRSIGAEFGEDNVRANAVAYGNIGTPLTLNALDEEEKAALARESPMRRWGTPRDAAGASIFLLSDLASFVNGQTLVVDGGTLMR